MKYRIKGISCFGFGLSWEQAEGDKEVARRVIRFFEDRRLLYGMRMVEDTQHCLSSALDVRRFLTDQLMTTTSLGADLTASLQAMRAAMRRFVDKGGADGANFQHRASWGLDPFSLALGELRGTVCLHLANLAYQYGIEVEEDLARVLPVPDDEDVSWVPGFLEEA